MHDFNLYPQAWALYIGLGLSMLFLTHLALKNTSFKVRAATLSFLAAGAFTPQAITNAETYYAPIVFVAPLDAEVKGVSAIYQGLTKILLVWLMTFAFILIIKKVFGKNQKTPKQASYARRRRRF